MAVAEWLARLLHMQEVRGSNPGLGMHSFSCQMLKNPTKIGFVACQLLNFPSDFQQIHFNVGKLNPYQVIESLSKLKVFSGF